MKREVTVVVPSKVEMLITGCSRIEIGARKIKAFGMDPGRALHVLNRRNGDGTGSMSFSDLSQYVRTHGTRQE